MACHSYRPDHNGECLNCDEPADAHMEDEVISTRRETEKLQIVRGTIEYESFVNSIATGMAQRYSSLRVAIEMAHWHSCDHKFMSYKYTFWCDVRARLMQIGERVR